MAGCEHQHAAITLAEVASPLQVQFLPAVQNDPGAGSTTLWRARDLNGCDEAERYRIIDALCWGVERVGYVTLYESTCQRVRLEPPAPQMLALFDALRADQDATD